MEEKYYEIITFSPYEKEMKFRCIAIGEHMNIHAIARAYLEEDTTDWYDEAAQEDYGEAFFDECSYDLYEITENKYKLWKEMR